VRIKVLDGAGNPALSGSVTLDGTNYPNAHRFSELTPEGNGVVQFDNLSEGSYAISGTQNGLGGRVNATIVKGAVVEVTVQLQAAGTVKGRVFMPGGIVPIGLGDVELILGGRNVGFTTTSDADEDRGTFTFLNVPSGDFTVNVLDNRTGRVGRTAGRVTDQGQVVTVNVELLTVGAVAGQVTANGVPIDHALVTIAADGSGIRGANSQATTDPQGHFRFTGIPSGRFTVSISNAPGGQTGSATGIISGTVEPLPDTIVNITLEPSVTLTGTVYKLGGGERVNGAIVKIIAAGRAFETATNESGVYRLSFVPLGEVRVRAESPTGYDRGEAAPVMATLGGTTVTSDVVLNGTGAIHGDALDNAGGALATGTITLTNDAWSGAPVIINVPVSNGHYEINGTPAGHFSLRLIVPNRVGVGAAAGDLAANQNLDLPIRLEDAGSVTGIVKTSDGSAPVAGVDISATLSRSSGTQRFYTHTNTQGAWSFENIPLGSLYITASDLSSGGIARANNVTLSTNGQTVDVGVMLLDKTAISVVSVEPANGTTLLPTNGTIVKVTFSEPAEMSTVNQSTVQLQSGGGAVGATVSLSNDGLVATLTPNARLAESSLYRPYVNGVEDRAGLRLANAFSSTFTTADESAPTVAAIAPVNSATEIPINASINATFSEPIDRARNLSDIIKVTLMDAPDAPLAGSYELDTAGTLATFRPANGLAESSRYTITVNGQRDASGNVQTQAAASSFTTQDRTLPVIDALPIDGTRVRSYKPTITATYHDNLSGIKTSSLVLTVDNVNVTQGAIVTGTQATYTPATALAGGHHTITVQVSDNAGNVSTLRSAAFEIDDSGPAITNFTIGGTHAVDGMYVTSSLQPVFALSYTDDTGINLNATKLLFAPQGSPLVQVPATVTATGITYQPPAYLAEGPYAVQAIVTNNFGTSSTTGLINFTLDVDAPEIASVAPATGSQHGGTTVTINGARLLSTTNAAPNVTIGGNPAQVTSAVAGTPDSVTLITPAGTPGAATIQMSTNRGTGVQVGGFTYTADARTPFIAEHDTMLLWHLDEPANGSIRINDDGLTHSAAGTSSSASLAQPGRFAGGRSNTSIYTESLNSLSFGSSGFTVEGWVKTDVVGRTYTLLGKEDYYGGYYSPPEWALRLLPTGDLKAQVYDADYQHQWTTQMARSVYAVDDNQWHYLAMVLDRTASRLSIYVDGVERANAPSPAVFGSLPVTGNSFRAGHWAYYDPQTTGGPEPFPGTLDEIRVSNTAHTADVIQKTYLGTEGTLGVSLTNSGPLNIARGTTIQLPLTGYNLAGTTASVNSSSGAQVTARMLASAATQASVQLTVAADSPIGDAQLVISSSQGSATLALRVIDLSRIAYAVESDTRLLWHLNETDNGYINLFDEGPLSINGTTSGSSLAQPGRFAGGRSSASGYTATSLNELYFGSSNFTVEGWMKTDVVGRTYTLFGKEDYYGYYYGPAEWALRLQPTGALRAMAYDNSQRQWVAEMAPATYRVDDNQWHHVAMTIDRTAGKLSLYVDGIERASSTTPANFGEIYNSGQPFRIGHWAYYEQQTTGGPEPFPGTLDEIRISATAHSAERILNDVTGNSAMRVTTYLPKQVSREKAGLPSPLNQITVNGYNLEGVTAQLQVNGQTVNAIATVGSSSYRQAQVNVSVAATAPLGMAQLVLSKPGQPDVAMDVRVDEQAESSGFADTVLLWNLNETGNGYVRIIDGGPLGIGGTSGAVSTAQTGHFGGGRASANIASDDDHGVLDFGANSFTVECWMKTAQLGRTYTIVGKEDTYGNYYGPPDYAIRMTPSGALRALVYSGTTGVQLKAEMPALSYDLDDNYWHHVAMVMDRAASKLSLYVDGVERASVPVPANFGSIHNLGQPLRAGKWSYYDEATTGGPQEFPGTLDDIRISNTAHTAAQIQSNMNGVPSLRVNDYAPKDVQSNKASGEVFNTLVNLTGYGLDGITASLTRNGQTLDATVTVESNSFKQAQVRLSVAATVATGTAQLVLSKPGLPSVSVDLRIIEQSELATDPETRLLWHLNETGNGYVRIIDGGPLGIGGTTGGISTAQTGHFGGGRGSANIVSDEDYGALDFDTSNFTVECWMKTGTLGRTYTLVGNEDVYGNYYGPPQYSLRLSPSGVLRAIAYDTSARLWKAEIAGRAFDPATGRWQLLLDDNQWHHIAMTLDRTAGKLSLYVDGTERAGVPMPANFGPLLNNPGAHQFRVGKWSYYDEATTGGPQEFPGIIDEVRVSASAHTAERVLADSLGTDTAHVARMTPTMVQRGTTSVPVTFTGYGLTGATVTTDQPGATVSVVSSARTQLDCTLNVLASVPLGQLNFNITDTGGHVFNSTLTVVDQQPFVNAANSGTETLVLWHMDDAGNGAVRINGTGDAVPGVIGGTAGSISTAQTGRFGGGRTNANIQADVDNGALTLGSNSFTVECWMKTATVGRSYTLVGKEDTYGNYYGPPDFALRLLPSGGLRAVAYDTSNRQWKAEMPGRLYDSTTSNWMTILDDNQWHYVAMVVDRTANKLSLYADGVERAATGIPANFAGLRNNGELLRAGKWSYYDEATTGGPLEFPGTLDEVRVLKYARTAAEVKDTWLGTSTAGTGGIAPVGPQLTQTPEPAATAQPSMSVNNITPGLIERDKAAREARVTNLIVTGADLTGVRARVARDGHTLKAIVASVQESTETQARLALAVAPNAPLGPAELVLSKPGYKDVSIGLRINEPGEFAPEADTVGLWHLDEREEGAAHLQDASEHNLHLSAAQASRVDKGRFGAARKFARATGETTSDALAFGSNSFTLEGWVKTGALERDYVLIGKETNSGQNTDYTVKLLASGAVRAEIYDTSGALWQAETTALDGSTLTDNQWHSVALVVDRGANLMFIYIDGRGRAVVPAPQDFAAIRNMGQPLEFGCYDADSPATGGPEEFPGLIDEVRISNTAHPMEKIAADFFGHDAPEVTRTHPATLQRGAGAVPVTLFGYGLSGATVTTNQTDVTINVVSTTETRVNLFITIPANAPVGPIQLTLTDALKQTVNAEMIVGERSAAQGRNAPPAPPVNASPNASRADLKKDQNKNSPPSVSKRDAPNLPPGNQAPPARGVTSLPSRATERQRAVGGAGQR
jgi:hypothetical protein